MNKRDMAAKVLVLSNHRILKGAMESCLTREFDVVKHEDSQQALLSLGDLKPDVVVMDLDHMHMMDGHSTAKWLHSVHPGIGAVFMMNFNAGDDSNTLLSVESVGESFTLDCMQGALQGIHTAIRDMVAAGEPEFIVAGYRLHVHAESRELAQTV